APDRRRPALRLVNCSRWPSSRVNLATRTRRRQRAGNTPDGYSSAMIPSPRSSRLPRISTLRFSIFLHPELIHAGERTRPFLLEGMPPIKTAHEPNAAEDSPIMPHDPRREFETDEFQIVLGEEGFDLRNRQPPLLDVE